MTSRNFFFPDWTRFWRVWSWLNGLHYSSFFVYGNLQQSALFGKFFLFDGNGTQVSFFENSAWTMTKALCVNAMAPEAFYSFFWLSYSYHDFPKNRRCHSEVYENGRFSDISLRHNPREITRAYQEERREGRKFRKNRKK